MRPIVSPKLLAFPVRAIFNHLRRRSAVRCDLRGSKAISQFLQDFNFICIQGFQQRDALLESHLETSSKRTLDCGSRMWRELREGREQRPFFCSFIPKSST
jgi:hypothetical protein